MTPLTIAQVIALPVDSWVAPGFAAVVLDVKAIQKKKTAGEFYKALLGDQDGSGATASLTMFTIPKFKVGDAIEVMGQGIKRGDYMGKAELKAGDKAHVTILPNNPLKSQGNTQREPIGTPVQGQTRTQMQEPEEPQSQSAPIHGAMVGASLNQAMEMMRAIYTKDELKGLIVTPHFWQGVHEFASDQVRLARLMESGKLAPSAKERLKAHEAHKSEVDENVPF